MGEWNEQAKYDALRNLAHKHDASICPECNGEGVIHSEWEPDLTDRCPTCGGSGHVGIGGPG